MAHSLLIIDAEQPFADDIAEGLRGNGLEVTVVGDGKDGLETAKTLEPKPSLIVLCVELPKMSGYSICNKLKKDDDLKSVPLIITSSEATPETFEQHKKLKTRADEYLIKPFDVDQLLEKIGALVALDADSETSLDLGGDDSFDLSNLAAEFEGGDNDVLSLDDDDVLSNTDELEALSVDDDQLDGLDLGVDEDLDALDAGDLDLDSISASLESLSAEDDSVFDSLSTDELAAEDSINADFDKAFGGDTADFLSSHAEVTTIDTSIANADGAFAGSDVDQDVFSSSLDLVGASVGSVDAVLTAKKPNAVHKVSAAAAIAVDSSKVNELEKQLREIRRERDDVSAHVAELETRLQAAEDDLRKKSGELDSIHSSSSSSQRELLDLKEQLHSKEKDLFKLKETAFAKEKAAFEAEERVGEVQRQADIWAQDIKDKDASIATLSSKVASLTEERTALEAELLARIDELENSVQQSETQRESQVQELETRLENETSSLQNRLDTETRKLEAQRDGLKSTLEKAEDLSRNRAEEIDRLKSEINDKDDQIAEMYRKAKDDDAIRQRAYKAVEIASALLSGQIEASDDDGGDGLSELSV